MSASKGTAINLPDYLRFGWLLFLALRVHSFSRFKDLVTCTNGLVSILVTTSPLSPSRSPASAANGSLPGVKMPSTPVTTAMTTAKAHIILEAIFSRRSLGERCIAGSLQSTNLMDSIWAEQRRTEALKLYYRVLEAMSELVLATHKTVTMLFPVVLERTGITAFDLRPNGDIRSPKRACHDLRSALVERNSFTSPAKDRLLALNGLKSKLPQAALQSVFASPTQPNPAAGGETCAETGINIFFSKRTALFFNRHIDQIILCSVYGVAKISQLNLTFREIVYNYRKQPQCKPQVFRSVLVDGSSTRHSGGHVLDPLAYAILTFESFLGELSLTALQLFLQMDALISHSSRSYYACVGESTHAYRSPSKDLTAINDRLNGKKVNSRLNFDDVERDIKVSLDLSQSNEIARYLLVGGAAASGTIREGWGEWFDKKGDFLRRDRMFKSNLELLNPMNNMLLQDPDTVGLTVLTRGDKLMQKAMLNEFRKLPFSVKNRFGAADGGNGGDGSTRGQRNEVKGSVRRTLDDNGGDGKESKDVVSGFDSSNFSRIERNVENGGLDNGSMKEVERLSYERRRAAALRANNVMDAEKVDKLLPNGFGRRSRVRGKVGEVRLETSGPVYADGKRWGYFPGLLPHLPFSRFMEEFFRLGKCEMKVFMVWNSPPWMFGVRHQRGLESLLYHHPDACVVVFSETLELDFFKDFVKDGYKVSVAMPNLDELLKNTPTHAFASLWFEWRKTKFYPTHYSELVRLAVLHMYGGMYLDFDVIVMKPLLSLHNSVGLENLFDNSSLNGAVMTFEKNSPFILECLKEFYATYDDTQLRWNGADLLTRVVGKFLNGEKNSENQIGIKMQPSSMFFPIDRRSITRYFAAPTDDAERDLQENLFRKILDESFTFHFWNSITSTLVPEPGSLVARLLNQHCMRCLDTL
ncbi:hypothetical protein Scep_013444 [Stephania cephalantha]|uniref:Retinoblastoma-associated protein A-box domain-containing protein n=1 Tax=Stephania cephalantha TaxID=152367 RepID=A0AAP0PAS7_9MAGN